RSPKPQVGGSIPSWPANYQSDMKDNTVSSKLSLRDISLWATVALITCATFYATYAFHFSGPIKAIIWLGWFVSCMICAFFTEKGQQVFEFANEAKVELQKVVWPTRQETIQTTSIVMLMVVAAGFILWGVDAGMMWAIGKITHLG
ncbi:MAG: preprotein translocase subunit SecE, partial [Legionellaceae bacterium]